MDPGHFFLIDSEEFGNLTFSLNLSGIKAKLGKKNQAYLIGWLSVSVDKGGCRALAEVCSLPSAVLDNVM